MNWFHHRCTNGLSDDFLKMDWRGDTLLEMAKLPEDCYLDISHRLDALTS